LEPSGTAILIQPPGTSDQLVVGEEREVVLPEAGVEPEQVVTDRRIREATRVERAPGRCGAHRTELALREVGVGGRRAAIL
jgi:hypothetical protein